MHIVKIPVTIEKQEQIKDWLGYVSKKEWQLIWPTKHHKSPYTYWYSSETTNPPIVIFKVFSNFCWPNDQKGLALQMKLLFG